MEDAETICAISTPPGEGGIGIIRISGHLAHLIGKQIFKPHKRRKRFVSHRLYLGRITDPKSRRDLDQVLLAFMEAPHTYTREDMAEIHAHGGYGVQQAILKLILQHGARLAEPGEFTKRAFLNGRIDLAQAESVLDIIHSETEEELHYAIRYLKGDLSRKIQRFGRALRDALAATEALIDFPEEDIDVDLDSAFGPLKKIHTDIQRLIDSFYEGQAMKQGYEVLVAGRANVGKSSLFNALLLKDRAIVTPLAGTTRDLIEDTLYLKGLKTRLIDTAGIREPCNVVEEEGIHRVRQKVSEADLIIWLLDGSEPYSPEDEEVFRSIGQAKYLVAINKTDLPQLLERDTISSKGCTWIEISALKNIGLDALKDHIWARLREGARKDKALFITNMRHRDALARTRENIERAILLRQRGDPVEFIALELREGIDRLGEITGDACKEDILNEIFSRFCIGK